MIERIELIDNNESLQSVVFQDIEDYDENNDFKGLNELDKFLSYFSASEYVEPYIENYYFVNSTTGFVYFKHKSENGMFLESDEFCKRRIARDSIKSVQKLVKLIKETAKNKKDLLHYFTHLNIKVDIKNNQLFSHKIQHYSFNVNKISKWLRIYAVSINKRNFVITGGYLKPTKNIEETSAGINELKKIKMTYEFISNKLV